MKPTHQKARFRPHNAAEAPDDLGGMELWVRIGKPVTREYWALDGTESCGEGFDGHVVDDLGEMFVMAVDVELLPEFAIDPPPALLAEWLASERARLAGRPSA